MERAGVGAGARVHGVVVILSSVRGHGNLALLRASLHARCSSTHMVYFGESAHAAGARCAGSARTSDVGAPQSVPRPGAERARVLRVWHAEMHADDLCAGAHAVRLRRSSHVGCFMICCECFLTYTSYIHMLIHSIVSPLVSHVQAIATSFLPTFLGGSATRGSATRCGRGRRGSRTP